MVLRLTERGRTQAEWTLLVPYNTEFETLGKHQRGCPAVSRKCGPRAWKISQGSVSIQER